jgi:hypothetical protein
LHQEFADYFDPIMYSHIGWSEGAAREAMPLPPEVEVSLAELTKSEVSVTRWPWRYPQHNFYAMWKYAQIFPEEAPHIYELAKSNLQVPVPSIATTDYFIEKPFVHNAFITGYIGFLNLQELANKYVVDASLRTTVTTN